MRDWIAPDPIALHASAHPAALACIDLPTGRSWTYRMLDTDIQRAVGVLAEEGVAPGDRVAVLAPNSVDQLILQMALLRMEAIFVPLNWRLAPGELARILDDCRPLLLVTDRATPQVAPGCRVLQIAALSARIGAAEPVPAGPRGKADATAIILYTSGTSGTPKGVMLSPEFLFATGVNFGFVGEVDTGCVFLCESPMFHVIGIVTSIWPPLLRGGTILVSAAFEPAATNDRLADESLGITHYFCVPQMADALRHAENFAPGRWKTLKALFTGGAPNPPANILWWLGQGVRMVDGYGMTESGTTLGMPLAREVIAAKAGAVGLPAPATAVRIVDDAGRDVDDEVTGEVLINGPNVTAGYWNRPDEWQKSLTADGWLRTGDIGRRDKDGFIYIVGRRKDMFISGGENVYPVEVEAALAEHPDVREAAVVGMPDERWGEVGCAYIVLAPGALVSEEELRAHLAARVGRYKIPKEFRMVLELPRTGSGKIQKHILRAEVLGAARSGERLG